METYLQTVKEEWVKLINETDPDVHRLATELARDNATPLVAEFYRVVLADPSAAEFLTTEQVERQLQEALRRWLIDVLSCRVEQVEEQMRAQQRAADVHARIGISVDLVEMGFRVLKKLLLPVITTSAHSPEVKLHIYHYAINSIDLAMEVMSRAYVFSENNAAKEDENYRIFSLMENAEEEKERQTAALLIDVDKFKQINDTWGHNTGDEILRKVSGAFYDNVRTCDYVFRYGGDEFLIVLTEISEVDALRIAERIRRRVEKIKVNSPTGDIIPLSLSIGVAMFNGHPDYERLIQAADEALYGAKRRGRNCVELWKGA
ncbi:diguanylate cyclase [Enterobacter hormaechei]|uniref:diguanylate cyclase n=1 Tax=Enterobacter hormaechei TaxID=158836 RepID=UPI0039C180BF